MNPFIAVMRTHEKGKPLSMEVTEDGHFKFESDKHTPWLDQYFLTFDEDACMLRVHKTYDWGPANPAKAAQEDTIVASIDVTALRPWLPYLNIIDEVNLNHFRSRLTFGDFEELDEERIEKDMNSPEFCEKAVSGHYDPGEDEGPIRLPREADPVGEDKPDAGSITMEADAQLESVVAPSTEGYRVGDPHNGPEGEVDDYVSQAQRDKENDGFH